MKEHDGREVRRISGHSNEPAIQVICLVSEIMYRVCSFADTIRARVVALARTMLPAFSSAQPQQNGPRTRS
jgi:hypothetical protein